MKPALLQYKNQTITWQEKKLQANISHKLDVKNYKQNHNISNPIIHMKMIIYIRTNWVSIPKMQVWYNTQKSINGFTILTYYWMVNFCRN